jgi:hypothetical protein
MFAAGAAASGFLKSRPDGLFIRFLLLTGSAYLLFFPLHAIAIVAWMDIDQFFNRKTIFHVGYDVPDQFFYHWLGGLGGYNPVYLAGVAICSALFVFVRDRPATRGPPPTAIRTRDIAVGLALLAFGVVLGLARYAGVVEQVRFLADTAKQLNQPHMVQGAALLQSDLWKIVGWSALPYVVVGILLLLPLRRLASHRPTGKSREPSKRRLTAQ